MPLKTDLTNMSLQQYFTHNTSTYLNTLKYLSYHVRRLHIYQILCVFPCPLILQYVPIYLTHQPPTFGQNQNIYVDYKNQQRSNF